MRLLHAKELRFEEFFSTNRPAYAILSHRWGSDEVSFQELLTVIEGNSGNQIMDLVDLRFSKIQKTRELARIDGKLDWVWIDTCNIDKKSSAELSEAINSMFQWHKRARVCLVYMSDVSREQTGENRTEQSLALKKFEESDWFNRGWTLQELLAPDVVDFYDYKWNKIGGRKSLSQQISVRTGIETCFLEGTTRLDKASVAKKMSWVSACQTTREEDIAYCLLGLFDVNMPLLYGEGPKAFMRLQLEIIRKSDDESIFAWRRAKPKLEWELKQVQEKYNRRSKEGEDNQHIPLQRNPLDSGLLAQEPRDFASSGDIQWRRDMKFTRRLPYNMTNQGLQFYVDACPSDLQLLTHVGDPFDTVLNCYRTTESLKNAGT